MAACFHAGFFLSLLFFYPEDGGDMFLRNVGWQRTTRRYIPEDGILPIPSISHPISTRFTTNYAI
jgi:hypothetical protein